MAFTVLVCTWQNIVYSVKTCYRFFCNHLNVLVAVVIFFILYRLIPSVMNSIFSFLFSLIVSSSPILVCTLVLLQILFSFRSSPPVEEDKKAHDTAAVCSKSRYVEDHPIVENHLNVTGINKRRNVIEKPIPKPDVNVAERPPSSKEKKVSFLSTDNNGGFSSKSISIEEHLKGARDVDKEIKKKENLGSKVDASGSSAGHVEDNNAETLFDSDCAECSSTDNADVLPILDEIDPLLESTPPQPSTLDESDAASVSSEGRSIEGSVDSENRESASGVEEDGTKVVSWTEDDQKNLMDLGTSELERNQRLENLIARRRAKKIYGKMAEKNLIDFDSNDIPPLMPAISTAKSNPFDLPYNTDIEGLPPIPGSAPSILVPRQNPFDLPYDPLEERPDLTRDSFQQEYMSALQKDMFFCRHESFSWGPSFFGGFQQERHNKSSPYFEGTSSDGREAYNRFLEELVGKSDSRLDTVPESDTPSSVASRDLDDRFSSRFHGDFGEKSESKLDPVPESISSPTADRLKSIEQESTQGTISGSEHSNDADSIEAVQEEKREEQESNQGMISQSDQDEVDLVEAIHEEDVDNHLNNNDVRDELSSPETSRFFTKPDVVEENYEGTSSSSTDGENFEGNTQSKEVEKKKGECNDESSSSSPPSLAVKVSDSKCSEGMDDHQPVEPVYDSSPSAVEKRTIDESVFYVDKGILISSSSLASDMHVEVSDLGSPRQVMERSFSYTVGEASFRSAVAPEDYVEEEPEPMSVKVGVSGYELNTTNSDSASVDPEPLVEQSSASSNPAPAAETESLKEGSTSEASHPREDAEMSAEVPQTDVEVVDSMPSHPSPNSEEKQAVQSSSGDDHHEETQGTSKEVDIVDSVNEPLVEDGENKDDYLHNEHIRLDHEKSVTSETLIIPPEAIEPVSTDNETLNEIQGMKENDIQTQVSRPSLEEDGESKQVHEEVDISDTNGPPEMIETPSVDVEESTQRSETKEHVPEPSHVEDKNYEQVHEEIEISMDTESRHNEQQLKETEVENVKVEPSDQDRDPLSKS